YPSGADLATIDIPMLPPAPALFSTTTGCPHCSDKLCAIKRARVSVTPPAVNGTTSRTGLSGYDAAAVAALAPDAMVRDAVHRSVPAACLMIFIAASLVGGS